MSARRSVRFRGRVPLVLVLLLSACDGGTGLPEVGSVIIAPTDTVLEIGAEVQLVATVLGSSGSAIPGHPVAWTSTNDDVASVSEGGRVLARTPGTARVTAESQGRSASVRFSVRAGPCQSADAGTIHFGETRSGSLGPVDCSISPGERAAGWIIDISEETILDVRMTSSGFEPFILVTNTNRQPILWGPSRSANTARALGSVAPGRYYVWATSLQQGVSGDYELSAQEARECSASTWIDTVGPGDARQGLLDDGDCLLYLDPADGYRLSLSESTGLRVTLSSTAFPPIVAISNLDMEILWWDAVFDGSAAATIERRIPAGEYLIWVVNTTPLGGAYQLVVEEVEIELCPLVGTLPVGESVSGTLVPSDCRIEGGRLSQAWALELASPATLQIDLTSNQFDAFLIVEDEHGDLIAFDDDGGSGLNSRLVHAFPEGTFRVVVTTYWPGETGAYQLSAHPTAPGAAPVADQEQPSGAEATPKWRGPPVRHPLGVH